MKNRALARRLAALEARRRPDTRSIDEHQAAVDQFVAGAGGIEAYYALLRRVAGGEATAHDRDLIDSAPVPILARRPDIGFDEFARIATRLLQQYRV